MENLKEIDTFIMFFSIIFEKKKKNNLKNEKEKWLREKGSHIIASQFYLML